MPEYYSGLPFPSPGHLPNPAIEPGSPTLYADAIPSEPSAWKMTSAQEHKNDWVNEWKIQTNEQLQLVNGFKKEMEETDILTY